MKNWNGKDEYLSWNMENNKEKHESNNSKPVCEFNSNLVKSSTKFFFSNKFYIYFLNFILLSFFLFSLYIFL
jgi:hypothetical protein